MARPKEKAAATGSSILGVSADGIPGVPSTSGWPETPPETTELPGDSQTPGGSRPPNAPKRFILMTINDRYMNVDGVRQETDPGYQTAPMLIGARTLVPIRAIVETMGGTVGWDELSQEISLLYGESMVKMWPDATRLTVNSIAHEMDVAPTVIDFRTRVPIRFAAEYLGCGVDWIEDSQQIVIVFQ